MDSVVHFEMPYDDAERAVTFYRAAFGWELQQLGEDMGLFGEPMEIPGIGRYVAFQDPEGNRLSMLQPVPRG